MPSPRKNHPPIVHRLRGSLLSIALLLLPLPGLGAQDTNAGGCAVNGTDPANDTAIAECAENAGHALDWVPIGQVPEALRDRQCKNCEGRYIDPLADEDTDTPPSRADINASADSTEVRENEAVFTGEVQATQGYRRLRGDTATIYRETESAVLQGNVTLREPGVLVAGEQAEVFSQSGEARIDSANFVFHDRHMRGYAGSLQRDEEGFVHIHDGGFSYCAPGEKDWALRADNLLLDFEEGVGTARDAKIDVMGVPVLYTPWLQFPLDDRRRTGFLWPQFGNDSTGGLDITVPFYLNLAPNYDALYSPRLIEERGLNHELLLRYLHPKVGSWAVGGAWMHDDDRYADQVGDARSSDRWLGVVRQDGLFNQRWRSRIDYSKASDVDYLADLETSNLDSQRQTSLLQMASLDYLGDAWLVNLEARQFQSLADDINDDYQKLPELTARYRSTGQPFQIEPLFLAQATNFDTDEDRVTGRRLYAEAGAAYPMRWLAGFLEPTVKYRQLYYDLDDSVAFPDNNPSAGSALASIDGGLIFERQTGFGERRMLQTLEPRLYYLYSEREDQTDQPDFDSAELTFSYNQLFRETRFAGNDRLDDANHIALGLTTNFIDEIDGRNVLSASIGQIFYFQDREVRLSPNAEALDDSDSEIAAELNFAPDDQFLVRSSLVYDANEGRMNSGHVHTGYHAENGGIYNLGYSYRRPNTVSSILSNQPATAEASVSAYMPLGNNWALFGAMNYSTQANRSVEDMVGFEYDSCCWTFRFLYLRYFNNESGAFADFSDPNLERENTAQFQIVLKGMGGFGDRITDIMEDLIRGFEEREY